MTAEARGGAYLTYLLHLWREVDGEEVVWRSSLKSAQTLEQVHFATFTDLVDFLRQRTGALEEFCDEPQAP